MLRNIVASWIFAAFLVVVAVGTWRVLDASRAPAEPTASVVTVILPPPPPLVPMPPIRPTQPIQPNQPPEPTQPEAPSDCDQPPPAHTCGAGGGEL